MAAMEIEPTAAATQKAATEQNYFNIKIINLTKNVTEEHIKEIFGYYGIIRRIYLPEARTSGKIKYNRGFAIVEYASSESTHKAILYMNEAFIDGEKVQVVLTEARKQREPMERIPRPARKLSGRSASPPPPPQRYRREPGRQVRQFDDRPRNPNIRRSPPYRRPYSRSPSPPPPPIPRRYRRDYYSRSRSRSFSSRSPSRSPYRGRPRRYSRSPSPPPLPLRRGRSFSRSPSPGFRRRRFSRSPVSPPRGRMMMRRRSPLSRSPTPSDYSRSPPPYRYRRFSRSPMRDRRFSRSRSMSRSRSGSRSPFSRRRRRFVNSRSPSREPRY
ncbi:hypothetical protein MP638_004203 [Amoeboaphelidium occidentale]|nr:hypothetical protein MP638_004203 [Amoeboaphelidium occidentale]